MIIIREPHVKDEASFLAAMKSSESLHHPWVKAPLTSEEYSGFIARAHQDNQKCFLVCDDHNAICGVFNISEIVRGLFQNAYLGFYAVSEFAGRGYMSLGFKLVLKHFFEEMGLHRIEANIQPSNLRSIQLVQKNGFRKEGYSTNYLKIDGVWRDHERWAMTYEHYLRHPE